MEQVKVIYLLQIRFSFTVNKWTTENKWLNLISLTPVKRKTYKEDGELWRFLETQSGPLNLIPSDLLS